MRFPTETSKKKKRYVTFKCPRCGDIETKIYQKFNFINLCQHCAKGGYTTEQFIEIGRSHFGNRYDYSKTVYTNIRTDVVITCPVHGDFTQRAQEHLDGHGCNQCKFDRKKEDCLLPVEEWEARIEKFPLLSFKDKSQIKGYHDRVTLVCAVHGEFEAPLGSLQSASYVCKQCANHAHQKQSIRDDLIGSTATLYYVYLPEIGMYKFGVTVNLQARLRHFKNYELKAKGQREYLEALRLEHKVHTELNEYRYSGTAKLLPTGSTELFTEDVLPAIKRVLQE